MVRRAVLAVCGAVVAQGIAEVALLGVRWASAGLLALNLVTLLLLSRMLHAQRRRVASLVDRREREWLGAFRQARHRLMNDLQVALGWLQLGEAVRAGKHLDALVGRLQEQGRLLHLEPPAAVRELLRVVAEGERRGVRVTLQVGRLPVSLPLGRGLRAVLERAVEVAAAQPRPGLHVHVGSANEGAQLTLKVGDLPGPELAAVLGRVDGVRLRPAPGEVHVLVGGRGVPVREHAG